LQLAKACDGRSLFQANAQLVLSAMNPAKIAASPAMRLTQPAPFASLCCFAKCESITRIQLLRKSVLRHATTPARPSPFYSQLFRCRLFGKPEFRWKASDAEAAKGGDASSVESSASHLNPGLKGAQARITVAIVPSSHTVVNQLARVNSSSSRIETARLCLLYAVFGAIAMG